MCVGEENILKLRRVERERLAIMFLFLIATLECTAVHKELDCSGIYIEA
jgi:hypothetical protein